jgi:hypothetical protein
MAVKSAEQIRNRQSSTGQGFGHVKPPQGKTNGHSASSSAESEADILTALAAHQDFEQLALALSRSSDNRLISLADALVDSRKQQVKRFCDFLDQARTGELDLKLIGAELKRRKERRADLAAETMPTEFDVDAGGFGIDLDDTIDCTALITGFASAKAIAGV